MCVLVSFWVCVCLPYRVSVGASWALPPLLSTRSWLPLVWKIKKLPKGSENRQVKQMEPSFKKLAERGWNRGWNSTNIMEVSWLGVCAKLLFPWSSKEDKMLESRRPQGSVDTFHQIFFYHLLPLLLDLCFHGNRPPLSLRLGPAGDFKDFYTCFSSTNRLTQSQY